MTDAGLKGDNTTPRAAWRKKISRALYRRPKMTGQARDEEKEAVCMRFTAYVVVVVCVRAGPTCVVGLVKYNQAHRPYRSRHAVGWVDIHSFAIEALPNRHS